jgi:lantibiotic leader peptide-processing serine protease
MRSRLLASALLACALALPASAAAAPSKSFIVLYKKSATPASLERDIHRAGGKLVADYSQIGVAVARSSDSGFAAAMRRDSRVDGAVSTAGFGSRVALPEEDSGPPPGDLPAAPVADSDPLFGLQWDMRQIHTPEAHAITGGSPSVVVGDIDTGGDKDHPDLAGNIDFSKSVSCESGAPDPSPAAWDDRVGHGTHTAGTIAAGVNGIGIVGTAPNVRLAIIKSSNDEGYFFPEMVVCSFMWAGAQQLDVTNNSYFADPYLFNCRNDPIQRAIWKAESRAIRWAQSQGVTVVASEGNESEDLSHPGIDSTSPDFPPDAAEERDVSNACVVIPVEVPGVVGVTAVGNREQTDDEPGVDYLKSYYSSYGQSTADLTAPGGDALFGVTPQAVNGRVLSTYPAELPCARRVVDPAVPTAAYCYLQGTSMAAPHVSGVAALIVSRYGDADRNMSPGRVQSYLTGTSDAQPCPTAVPAGYERFTTSLGEPQQCTGGPGHNSWYGSGHLNALRAVTHDTGN